MSAEKFKTILKKMKYVERLTHPHLNTYYKTTVPKVNRVKLIGLEIKLFLWPNDVKYRHKDPLM